MSDQAMKNQEEVAEINRRFMADEITGQEAVALLQPIADRVNAKAKEIAQELGLTSRGVSGSMRKLVNDGFCEKLGASPAVYAITDKGITYKFDN